MIEHPFSQDCEILPKLHHMRVAVARLKRFEIPASYVGIWRYLNNAYNEDAFQKSCPPDQERWRTVIDDEWLHI